MYYFKMLIYIILNTIKISLFTIISYRIKKSLMEVTNVSIG